MYFLTVVAVTTERHVDHDKIGGAYVSCWIDRDTEEKAITTAHDMIVSDGWKVVRTEEIAIVSLTDYDETDASREYFEQALLDKEVLVFDVWPRFPIYHLSFEITSNSNENTANTAKVWITNETVGDSYDPMELDFWSGDRITKAISIATNAIADNGYEVVCLTDQFACSRDDAPKDCQFYDDAQENGLCLVFVYDYDSE